MKKPSIPQKFWFFYLLLFAISLILECWVGQETIPNGSTISFFFPWLGMASCLLIILVSLLFGFLVKRPLDTEDKRSKP